MSVIDRIDSAVEKLLGDRTWLRIVGTFIALALVIRTIILPDAWYVEALKHAMSSFEIIIIGLTATYASKKAFDEFRKRAHGGD